jgi:flagellar biosynthesis protein FlhF
VEVIAAANRDMSECRPAKDLLRQPAPPARDGGAQAAGPSRADGHADAIIARLCAAGLDRALAADVARTIPRTRRREVSGALLRRAVADALETLAVGDERFAPAEVFIGPPGVGKTTTIAKIAAQERARHGTRLGLIAADGFRVGAVEQLRLYADIIGAPFMVARSPRELEAALGGTSGTPVLVDTAGRTVGDRDARDLIEFLGRQTGFRTHLVLSAAMSLERVSRLLDAYEPARPARVALTRLDETTSVGPLLGLLRARRLRVSFLGTGQRVPEDLDRATGPGLAAHVLGDAPEQIGDRA